MQTAETVVAINRDPDAPIAEFADLSSSATCSRSAPRSWPSFGPAGLRLSAATGSGTDRWILRSFCRPRVPLLAALFVLFLRRAGRLGAANRDLDRFRNQVADLAGRVELSLASISGRIDAVRRGSLPRPPDSTTWRRPRRCRRYADEGRGLRPPDDGHPIRDELVDELERARALEMVEHGCTDPDVGRAGSRGLEAQTCDQARLPEHPARPGSNRPARPGGRGARPG